MAKGESPCFSSFVHVELSSIYVPLAGTQVCSRSRLPGKVAIAQLNLGVRILLKGEVVVWAGQAGHAPSLLCSLSLLVCKEAGTEQG